MTSSSNQIGQSYTMQSKQGTLALEKVDSEKDLGVIIDKSLSFRKHISNPGSMTTLGQRSILISHSVGPTL